MRPEPITVPMFDVNSQQCGFSLMFRFFSKPVIFSNYFPNPVHSLIYEVAASSH